MLVEKTNTKLTQALLIVDAPNTNPFQQILGLTQVERSLYALDRGGVEQIILFAPNSKDNLQQKIAAKNDWKATISYATSESEIIQKLALINSDGLLIMTEPLVVQPAYIQQFIAKDQKDGNCRNAAQTIAFFKVNNGWDKSLVTLKKQITDTPVFEPKPANLICQKVQNKADFKQVKKALMKSLIKPTDGWVSRNINRKISTTFSRALANSPITPNQISVGTMLIGLITGYYLAQGGYFYFLVGATLFQATSVLDGVDGELARLRYQQSDFGQWLDTIADNLTYVAALVGIIIGVYTNDSPPYILWAGYIGLGMVFLTLASQYLYLIRFDSGGSLLNIPYNFKKGETTFDKIMQYAEIFGRRDFFAFVFFIFGILGIMPFSLVYVSLMVTIVLGFSIQAHFMAARKKKEETLPS